MAVAVVKSLFNRPTFHQTAFHPAGVSPSDASSKFALHPQVAPPFNKHSPLIKTPPKAAWASESSFVMDKGIGRGDTRHPLFNKAPAIQQGSAGGWKFPLEKKGRGRMPLRRAKRDPWWVRGLGEGTGRESCRRGLGYGPGREGCGKGLGEEVGREGCGRESCGVVVGAGLEGWERKLREEGWGEASLGQGGGEASIIFRGWC